LADAGGGAVDLISNAQQTMRRIGETGSFNVHAANALTSGGIEKEQLAMLKRIEKNTRIEGAALI